MWSCWRQLGLGRVDTQEHAHAIARVRIAHTEELAHVLEALSAKRPVERMVRVIELDEDVFVLCQMRRSASAEHAAELRPCLLRPVGKIGECHRRAVDAQQPAAGQHELQQVLPQHRIGEQVARPCCSGTRRQTR